MTIEEIKEELEEEGISDIDYFNNDTIYFLIDRLRLNIQVYDGKISLSILGYDIAYLSDDFDSVLTTVKLINKLTQERK